MLACRLIAGLTLHVGGRDAFLHGTQRRGGGVQKTRLIVCMFTRKGGNEEPVRGRKNIDCAEGGPKEHRRKESAGAEKERALAKRRGGKPVAKETAGGIPARFEGTRLNVIILPKWGRTLHRVDQEKERQLKVT